MHIPENYLSPETCAVMALAMVPVWTHAVRKVKQELPKEELPMLGVGAAFSFLGMMFNVPLVGGTTGHAVGGTLIAILFGPDAACIAVSIALLLQAVIFGDGGILAFGANCFNMAFVLPYVGYAIYRLISSLGKGSNGWEKANHRRQFIGAALGSYVGLALAALCTAIEFGLQPMLFHDEMGNALYCPYDLSIAIPAMMIPHLLVAGFVEAGFTLAVYAFLKKTAPDFIFWEKKKEKSKREASGRKPYPVFALVALLIVLTPIGLLAQGSAWGEWGADEVAEVVTNGQALGYVPEGLANGWSLSVLLPDYEMEGLSAVPAYLLSAVIGVSALIIIFKLLSVMATAKRRE